MKRMLCALMLAVFLLGRACLTRTAHAEVVTLSVTLTGVRTDENGMETAQLLSGRFRVFQNGVEAGTVDANGGGLTLSSSDRIHLVPMIETRPVGWDWSGAERDVTPAGVGLCMVSIVVSELIPSAAEETTP